MLRRIALCAVAATALGVAACDGLSSGGAGSPAVATPTAPADIGEPLFKPAEWKAPDLSAARDTDPLVIQEAQLTVDERQDVPSQVDGKLEAICTEIPEGTDLSKIDPALLFEYPEPVDGQPARGARKYRLIKEGEFVQKGQLVALLDARRALADLAAAEAAVRAAEGSFAAAGKIVKAAEAILRQEKELRQRGLGSERDYVQAEAGVQQREAEKAEKEGLLAKSREELKKALVQVQLHEIRASIPGYISSIYRKKGYSVKALDPVMQIHNTTRLRAEGVINRESFGRVESGMSVVIEPSAPAGPDRTLIGHMQPVTAVAVGKDGRLVVSASEDRTVRLWDGRTQRRVLTHPVPVRAVACTPPSVEGNFCLSGADDGKLRLWDQAVLANPADKKSATPVRVFDGGHAGAVHCVAFAPTGTFCATADDRDVIVWDWQAGKELYRLPNEHRGPVTSLQFTPQARLITAARDNTLLIWSLGQKGARVEDPAKLRLEKRSGEVPFLGVSQDGTQVLFDSGSSLQILGLPAPGHADSEGLRTIGVLENSSEAHFATFALFGPDGRTVLTGTNAEGRMRLWRSPARGERPSELRQYVSPDRTSVPTCAAYSPDGKFVVTGTADRKVFVWPVPGGDVSNDGLPGTVTYVEPAAEANGRHVRVWAELTNKDNRLLPGSTVTIIVNEKPAGR